jgi:uncharacterized protein (TIGR02001 family)
VRSYRGFFNDGPTAEFLSAMFEEGSDRDNAGCSVVAAVALSMVLLGASPPCEGADPWGGSVDLTSDYLVRGISRSDDHPALQLDLHYVSSSGFVAGAFASSAQIDPDARRDAELSAFLGYVWSGGNDWQGKILAANYSYPWNQAGSLYNYDEIDLQVTYRQWIQLALAVYPDVRRYSYEGGVAHVLAESAELNLQRPLIGRLSATAGVGYYELGGADRVGYAYWSVGGSYDWAPISLGLAYVGTSGAANPLFYNAAVGGRWSGTVIWRF